ncbi:MAG: hypothetical protein A2Z29_04070 [Chloroflexi bacterium RBG_16_56_11]|nr:MAG: hypothetical protein A2Z29_04070 [Chloroflexi bacterium RBG_16_56_11]
MITDLRIDNPQRPKWKKRLYLPAYSIKESAYYAGTYSQTVSYWHHHFTSRLAPAIPKKIKGESLSYYELIEVAFVATMRKENISLQRIRNAREYARQTFKVEYPFAELRWQTEGTHLLLELRESGESDLGKLIVADKHGQEAWKPVMAERFKQFEYENGIALIWHVRGTQNPITINPRISFGAPTINGIPTWVIKGRAEAGETPKEIEEDFNIGVDDIALALQFEGIKLPELAS